MKKITRAIFEENQRKHDEIRVKKIAQYELEQLTKQELERKENIKKLVLLKDELNLTEKIFNLGSDSFNQLGMATIHHIYLHHSEYFYSNFAAEERKEYDEKERTLNLLWFFKDSPENLSLLVDDLSPEAVFEVRRSKKSVSLKWEDITLYYYHPEMDKRNYRLLGRYGLIGKFFVKYY